VFVSAASVCAQNANDGSDLFLAAYGNFQKAEALEKKGDKAGALALYEEVFRALNQLVSQYPQWNPQVVKLRTDFTDRAIKRLRGSLGVAAPEAVASGKSAEGGKPEAGAKPEAAKPVPGDSKPVAGGGGAKEDRGSGLPPSLSAPISSGRGAGAVSGGEVTPLIPRSTAPAAAPAPAGERGGIPLAPNDPFAEIQAKLAQLQNDLNFALDEAQRLRREKAELIAQLEELTQAKAKAENRARILEQRSDVAEKALLAAKEENVKFSGDILALQKERDLLLQQKRELQAEQAASEEVRRRVEARLAQARGRETNVSTEREAVNQRLAEANRLVAQLQAELEKSGKDRAGVQTKLDKALAERDEAKSLAQNAERERDAAKKLEKEALKAKEQSEKASLQAGMERDAAKAALVKVTQERDDAVALAAKLKDARSQIDRLEAQNREAAEKLAKAQDQLKQKGAGGAPQGEALAALRAEVEAVRTQLQDSQKKAQESEKTVTELRGKLEGALKEGATAKTEAAQATQETEREREEKEVLHGILRRTMVEQGKRDEARKALVAEVARLKIDSEVLVKQIGLLGEPILQLTEKEQALFKQPLVEISEEGISISAIKTSPKKGGNGGAKPGKAESEEEKKGGAEASKEMAKGAGGPTEAVRLKMAEAKEHFERGDFENAEKLYTEALTGSPQNAFILSNLGVTQFRAKKFAKAEETLGKALELAPQDAFSRATLGIVYYTQGKLDKAVDELTESVVLNPNNAVAHNYLGIAASRKGRQENARKELEEAVALDPNYADAFFNLAVVCASQKPSDKEAARKAYQRAVELGASPDSRLEELIR
jgi:Flp pilus assembly protein TadD